MKPAANFLRESFSKYIFCIPVRISLAFLLRRRTCDTLRSIQETFRVLGVSGISQKGNNYKFVGYLFYFHNNRF